MGRCIRKFTELDWITGEGYTAQTADIERVTGNLRKLEVKISAVTGNANLTATVVISDISDTDFVTTLETFSALAHGTLHIFNSRSKEYDADKEIDETFFNLNDLRITVTPNEDVGGTLQTLTVKVKLYLD